MTDIIAIAIKPGSISRAVKGTVENVVKQKKKEFLIIFQP